jgi:hypothetical protein
VPRMEPPTQPAAAPAFSPQVLLDLYLRRRHDELSECFLAILRHFRDTTYHELDDQGRRFVNEFVKLFLTLFTQADYLPSRPHLLEMVALNATISNLVALSCFRDATGNFLDSLGEGPANLGKRLVLRSARVIGKGDFDRKAVFDADPVLASVWYGAFAQLYNPGFLDPTSTWELQTHFRAADARLDVRHAFIDAYFASSYVGGDCDRVVKPVINASFRRHLAEVEVRNRPDMRKVAVISGNWWPGHSVYRISRAFVEALDDYHRTLVRLGSKGAPDTRGFDRVVTVDYQPDGALDIRPVLDNDFGVVYYPDVGLKAVSILLANLRLAPIQITSTGHPVSTFGSEVDYYVSGVEAEPPDPERHYSERLVLLPGCGVVHERPDATPTGRRPTGPGLVLNCPWNAQKVNPLFAFTLRAVLVRADRPVTLRLYVNRSLDRQNDYLPFVRDLDALLRPHRVEVMRGLPYREYMARMEEGAFTIDSHPFGGCNSVADSLFLRRLVVTWESDYWYGRIGSWMVRQTGLPELAATSEGEYIDTVCRLIDDEPYRADLQARLDRADLDATVFARDEGASFRKAVDFLVANHDCLQRDPDRSPIRIAR